MKKMMIALTLLASVNAFAQDDECNQPSTIEIKACIGDKIEKADKEMNVAYQEALTAAKALDAQNVKDEVPVASPNEVETRLTTAQRTWVDFTSATCSIEAVEMIGGSGEGIIEMGCILRKTQERTVDLRKITKMLQGN